MKISLLSKVVIVLSSINIIVKFLKHRSIKLQGNYIEDLAILFALSQRQISDFCTCLESERFSEDFKVFDLHLKKLYICFSTKPSIKIIKDKIVLSIFDPLVILFLIKRGIKKHYYLQVFTFLIVWYLKGDSKYKTLNKTLQNDKRIDLFSTISTYGKHHEIFGLDKLERNFKTHVIHYAQNTLKIKEYGESKTRETTEDYSYDDICVWIKEDTADIHWVWTQNYANCLKQFNQKIEFRVVGSIQFQLPNFTSSNQTKDKILVFDSPPVDQDSAFANTSYYDFDTVTKFVSDIVAAKELIDGFDDFEIVFKIKRNRHHIQYSGNYLKFLESFELQNRAIIMDSNTNIYDLFRSSILSISFPFTSTAVIAKEQSVKSFFYYPYEKSIVNEIYEKDIPLICGEKKLLDAFQSLKL